MRRAMKKGMKRASEVGLPRDMIREGSRALQRWMK